MARRTASRTRRITGGGQGRPTWLWGTAGFLALAALVATGIGLYLNERDVRQRPLTAGSSGHGRINVLADVQKTDPDQRTATIHMAVTATGAYADPDGMGSPAKDVTVFTNSALQPEVAFSAEGIDAVKSVVVPLESGTASDYPFDRYRASLVVVAAVGDTLVPTRLVVRDQDPRFTLRQAAAGYKDRAAAVRVQAQRSRSTFILAWFMIAAMWAIALAVLVACHLVVRQRRGLVWGALGWMAGTLFALVGLRNAAPGNPPNGCLLDYAAFYWAEALIALSLTLLVFHGILVEYRHGGPLPEPAPGGRRTPSRSRRPMRPRGGVRRPGRRR
ncbi:DUF4436 family protein [Streptomyces ferrugineus]|uniref:DUF4436 family protein n=1 Tax=Streptomyces ferrugineus TaxID=1413221 RepID=A0A7M2SNI5_9ACTN|nr:DUF4436 family protein [Streptomyces ferrugineus]QOV37917.1 DUF4436 family protein [Streptomyces ferrugineus]